MMQPWTVIYAVDGVDIENRTVLASSEPDAIWAEHGFWKHHPEFGVLDDNPRLEIRARIHA